MESTKSADGDKVDENRGCLEGFVDKLTIGEHFDKDGIDISEKNIYQDNSFTEIEGCGSIAYAEVFEEDGIRDQNKTTLRDYLTDELKLDEQGINISENGISESGSKNEFEGCGSIAYVEIFEANGEYCDGDVLLDDLGQQLICHLEPTEFDNIIAAIEDTIIGDQTISELQLACVDEYQRLSSKSEDSAARKNEIFDKYRNGLCAALEVGVQKIIKDFKILDFMDKLFNAGEDMEPQPHPGEFEQSEVYELMQSMYNLQGFDRLVDDYIFMVNTRDVLSAVKVVPVGPEEM